MAAENFRSFRRFFWTLLKTNISHTMALRLDFAIQSVMMVANDVVMFAAWLILFHQFKEINGWHVQHLMLMTAIVMCSYSIYAFCFRGLSDTLAGYIDRGELDTFILQPRNILVNVSASRSSPSALGDLGAGVIFLFWCGLVTWATLPLLALCIIAGAMMFVAVGIFIGSLAFYMKDVEGWGLQIMHVFLHLTTQPGSIYVGGLRLFLIFVIPAGALTFMPVEIMMNPTWAGVLGLAGVTAAFFSAAVWFFYRGLLRYESGNAFGVRG
jgi:ABC-2 type transport system permease protein